MQNKRCLVSVVKAEMRRGAATPKIDVAGTTSVARTLIYLILKYYTVEKEILKYLKHYSKFMKYS
jgi:hypothetical protein